MVAPHDPTMDSMVAIYSPSWTHRNPLFLKKKTYIYIYIYIYIYVNILYLYTHITFLDSYRVYI